MVQDDVTAADASALLAEGLPLSFSGRAGDAMAPRLKRRSHGPLRADAADSVDEASIPIDEYARSRAAAIAAGKHVAIPFATRFVVAPMVGASDLAFRLLCRRYGAGGAFRAHWLVPVRSRVCVAVVAARTGSWDSSRYSLRLVLRELTDADTHSRDVVPDVCYTEMLDAGRLVSEPEYRQSILLSQLLPPGDDAADRPLIAQLAGNQPAVMAAAAALVKPLVDAVDVNLGCPQSKAQVGTMAVGQSTTGPALLDRATMTIDVASRC